MAVQEEKPWSVGSTGTVMVSDPLVNEFLLEHWQDRSSSCASDEMQGIQYFLCAQIVPFMLRNFRKKKVFSLV